MSSQKKCVEGSHTSDLDLICKWHYTCTFPLPVIATAPSFFEGSGGTYPSCIFKVPDVVDAIKDSDVWLLLTDGAIGQTEVERLTRLSEEEGVIQVPVILIITDLFRVDASSRMYLLVLDSSPPRVMPSCSPEMPSMKRLRS